MTNWGIIAPGRIANRFAQSFSAIEDSQLFGVASRNKDSATQFAAKYHIPTVFDSYADLIASPHIDAIYIASPHRFHFDTAKDCLQAGKAVLCEKPLTVTSDQAKELFAIAQQHNTFLMEALWSRFLPAWVQIKKWVQEGKIGELETIYSTFGFKAERNYDDRLFNLNLAGGSLLDTGVYNISLTQFLAQREPSLVSSHVLVGETGVDERCSVTLDYGSFTSQFTCSFRTELDNQMVIQGSKGKIVVPSAFWDATTAVLHQDNANLVELHLPYESSGFEYQVREVQQCLHNGQLYSQVMPPQQTISTMCIMESILSNAGIRFPFI